MPLISQIPPNVAHDDPGRRQSFKREYVYASDGTGNISQMVQYKYGNTDVLRTTTTSYLHESNPAYASANLTNLPVAVSIKDGAFAGGSPNGVRV
jgi:hypothetical protein